MLNNKYDYENHQEVPHHPLLVFKGTVQGIPSRILKDDGASTNIISLRFYEQHKQLFRCDLLDSAYCIQ